MSEGRRRVDDNAGLELIIWHPRLLLKRGLGNGCFRAPRSCGWRVVGVLARVGGEALGADLGDFAHLMGIELRGLN